MPFVMDFKSMQEYINSKNIDLSQPVGILDYTQSIPKEQSLMKMILSKKDIIHLGLIYVVWQHGGFVILKKCFEQFQTCGIDKGLFSQKHYLIRSFSSIQIEHTITLQLELFIIRVWAFCLGALLMPLLHIVQQIVLQCGIILLITIYL